MGGRDRLADIPRIELEGAATNVPSINVVDEDYGGGIPIISVQSDDAGGGGGTDSENAPPKINVFEVPGISVAGPEESEVPIINVEGHRDPSSNSQPRHQVQQARRVQIQPAQRRGGLICGGCDGPIVGRIVNAMGARWHPGCFRCAVCDALLEHVSSYEHEGRAYCHLDYHEVGLHLRCFYLGLMFF